MSRKWYVFITIILLLFVYVAGCSLPWRIVKDERRDEVEGYHELPSQSGFEPKPEPPPGPQPEPPTEHPKPNEPAVQNRQPIINANDINIVEKGAGTVALNPMDLRMYSDYIVTASASDPDGDSLSYLWKVTGGSCSVKNLDKNSLRWMPEEEGEYRLTVTVKDGRGGETTASIHVFAHAPFGVTP